MSIRRVAGVVVGFVIGVAFSLGVVWWYFSRPVSHVIPRTEPPAETSGGPQASWTPEGRPKPSGGAALSVVGDLSGDRVIRWTAVGQRVVALAGPYVVCWDAASWKRLWRVETYGDPLEVKGLITCDLVASEGVAAEMQLPGSRVHGVYPGGLARGAGQWWFHPQEGAWGRNFVVSAAAAADGVFVGETRWGWRSDHARLTRLGRDGRVAWQRPVARAPDQLTVCANVVVAAGDTDIGDPSSESEEPSYHDSAATGYDVATGETLWDTLLSRRGGGRGMTVTPTSAGLVLIGLLSDGVYALELATGRVVWVCDLGPEIDVGPIVADEHCAYVPIYRGGHHAIKAVWLSNGHERWSAMGPDLLYPNDGLSAAHGVVAFPVRRWAAGANLPGQIVMLDATTGHVRHVVDLPEPVEEVHPLPVDGGFLVAGEEHVFLVTVPRLGTTPGGPVAGGRVRQF